MAVVTESARCGGCGYQPIRKAGPCPQCGAECAPHDPDARARPGRCENEVGHEVRVKQWPPKMRLPASRRPASTSGTCRRCGSSVIVYDPPQEGIVLILPDGKPWALGRDKPKA